VGVGGNLNREVTARVVSIVWTSSETVGQKNYKFNGEKHCFT